MMINISDIKGKRDEVPNVWASTRTNSAILDENLGCETISSGRRPREM